MRRRDEAPAITSAERLLDALVGVRRARSRDQYAPHKPLLLLLTLARIQRGGPRVTGYPEIEPRLRELLAAFGPTNSERRAHMPFWHLGTDHDGALWRVEGPARLLAREPGGTPSSTSLRDPAVRAGLTPEVDAMLRADPSLLQEAARRVLTAYFPPSLHEDICAAADLDLDAPVTPRSAPSSPPPRGRSFREQVLRAYELRCCVCGFDLRVALLPAGLEAAHIHWRHAGGPDEVSNGLSLCALHHKLFDLGAFTIEPTRLLVVFSQHAIDGCRGLDGELRFHGRPMLAPQDVAFAPAPRHLAWNRANVFKHPERRTG